MLAHYAIVQRATTIVEEKEKRAYCEKDYEAV